MVEPGHALVLFTDTALVESQAAESREAARAAESLGDEPAAVPSGLAASGAFLGTAPQDFAASWAFVLEPLDGGRTRLIERFRVRFGDGGRQFRFIGPVMGFGVFVMMRRQMLGIDERAVLTAVAPRLPEPEATKPERARANGRAVEPALPDRGRRLGDLIRREVARGAPDAVGLPSMATDIEPRAPLADRVLSERVRSVPPSGIRRFFDIAASMDDVISLGVGEPDFDTPRVIVEAGVESLREGRTHYTSNFGTLELRRALARHLDGRYGVRYDPATEILVTVGASEAVDLALRATCDPGDEVILHEPSYVAYVPAVVFAGGIVRHVATRFEDDFALDPAAVEAAITPRTKALFLGYPCNPTGAVLPDDVQDALAEIAVRHDLLVYSDEIYDRLAYGTYRHRAMSALPGMRERTILMGGFSKAYAMTGWRVGYVAAPAQILEGMVKVHQYGIMSAPTTAQDAALAAIVDGEPDVERMLAEYDRRRRLIVDGLNALGLETFEPRGAFYAFPRIGSTGLSDDDFTERLLHEEHVAVVPGSAFGPSGAGHVRMCYATSYERLEEALRRIGRFVERVRAEAATPT